MKKINDSTRRELELEAARIDFWSFCCLMMPKFYRKERTYLRNLCDELQDFVKKSKKHFLVVNLPPRHGKSLTAQLFTAWLFGLNNQTKVMTASYNEKLSTTFARNVRNLIQSEKVDSHLVYSDIFPYTKIKYGEAQAQMWALSDSNEINYLATSPTSTATGFGAHFLLVDDVIKSAEDAYNENTLDSHWEWFNNTFLSRTENPWKIIIIMTRWAEEDLAGRVLRSFGDDVEHITHKAVQDDGSMLCDDVLSREDYEAKTKEMNLDIVEANYNQKPIDVSGRLYSEFKEWEKLPSSAEVINFTDTADTGEDFLCSIDGVIYQNEFYITDLVFTDEPMETTENKVAELLHDDKATTARIESNNGGRGFARNVEKILIERYGSNRCDIKAIPQTHNKESRILASSAWVQKHIYMPFGWKNRFPDFYRQVMSYQRKGKNNHDDAVDVLASIYEYVSEPREVELIDKSVLGSPRARAGRRNYWRGV